jgi:putative ABC transport system permease protein
VGEGEISWVGLATSLVLVAVAVGLSMWRGLGLERSIVWSCVRALVQLLLVALALAVVVDPEAPIALSWLWVLGMVLFAAVTVRRRAPEVPGAFPVALVAIGSATAAAVLVLFGLQIFPVDGRTVVPLSGMQVGASMTACVLAARRVVSELSEKRPEVEARLALGQPWQEASRPYVRNAVRTALTPQIETTKALGIVFLPGAMTGLILAGVEPFDAVQVQLAIMFLILGAVATTVTVVGVGLTRRLFTDDHRLVRLARTSV